MIKNKKGFTLIELLVVIAIIGLLSTLAVVALNNARAKSRDAKRVADVKQMQTALELYFNDCNQYPVIGAAGPLTTGMADGCSGTTELGTFLQTIPTPPTPPDGSNCAAANTYNYEAFQADASGCTAAGNICASYTIEYCLGATTGSLPGNTVLYATPAGMGTN